MQINNSGLQFLKRSLYAANVGQEAGGELRRMSEEDARRKPMVPGQERVQVSEGVFADITTKDAKASMGEAVYNKMMSGQPLSDEELAWLRENNPEEYQKALLIKMEREQYKKELEKCRSKEDVMKLKERKMQQFVAQANSIQGSGMSQGDKVKAMKFLEMRRMAIEYEHKQFMDTPKYKNLPAKRKENELPPPPDEGNEAKAKALAAELKKGNTPKESAAEDATSAAPGAPVPEDAAVPKTATMEATAPEASANEPPAAQEAPAAELPAPPPTPDEPSLLLWA